MTHYSATYNNRDRAYEVSASEPTAQYVTRKDYEVLLDATKRAAAVMMDAASAPGIDWLHWQIELGKVLLDLQDVGVHTE